MRITIFVLFILIFLFNSGNCYSQNTKISLDLENVTIKEVFDEIQNKTEFKILYMNSEIDLQRKISLKVKKKRIKKILSIIFANTDVAYEIIGNQIILKIESLKRSIKPISSVNENTDLNEVVSKEEQVQGTIVDELDVPLSGVNVVEKGTVNGTSTDFDGNYSITVSSDAVLIFTSVGFTTKEISVDEQSTINVSLVKETEQLIEIVVTALNIKKDIRKLGYSHTEVRGDELSEVKQTNAINALQGKIAGLNIVQNSTGAAGSSRVIIRGASSLTGYNQPLYIVDGIPIGNNTNGSAGEWGGFDGGDGISSINPDDIESVSVLKGGAASALYGSRASGGVILITTKSGKGLKKFGVEVNSSFTSNNLDISLLHTQSEYGQGIFGRKPVNQAEAQSLGRSSWGEKLDGSMVVQWDGIERPYSYVGSNWDHFYRTGTTFINTVALTGTNDNLNYRFSASNLKNEDIIPNSNLGRKSLSLNAEAVLFKKLAVQLNAKYIIEDTNNRPYLSSPPFNTSFTVGNLSPNVDVRTMNPGANADGTERGFSANPFFVNPYFSAFNYRNEDKKNRIIASTSLRYDFTDWLSLSARAGIDHYVIEREEVNPWGTGFFPLGAIWDREFRYTQIDTDVILGIEKNINDKFSVNALVGANSNYIKDQELVNLGIFFVVPGLENIDNTESQTPSKTFNERKIGSIYGSVELSYNRWAYLTFTGRNDWFSTLSFPGKTSPNDDFYSSINTSLVLSDALTMPKFINFLKFRGGYSKVAGGSDEAYQLSLTYDFFADHEGQNLVQINGEQVPNANLVAFSKNEFELGFDTRIFNNRLSLDLAYYRNETINDIVPVNTSLTSGYLSALANTGVVENKGIELLISGSPIKAKDFVWNTSFNISHNKGTVLATNDNNSNITVGLPRTLNIEVAQIVGEPFGTLFGNSYSRDDNGNIRYEIDTNGVPLAVVGDRKILGQGVSPTAFGVTNTFTYKDFRLSFLIDGKFGGQIYAGSNAVLTENGLHKQTLEGRENGLTVSGINAATNQSFTTTIAPENLQSYWGRISGIAEHFIEDNDFIKFRQLSLGYSFPNRVLKNTFFDSVHISATAYNFFFINRSVENIDPESDYQTGNAQGLDYFGVPPSKSYGLNINVKF